MDFFEKQNVDEEHKRDVAFQTVVAMRDSINLALKKEQSITYEQALTFFQDLDIDIYHSLVKLLSAKNENETVRQYKEEANLQTISQKKSIKPEELIEKDITRLEELLLSRDFPKSDTKLTRNRIIILRAALINMQPRHVQENRILSRDVFKADR